MIKIILGGIICFCTTLNATPTNKPDIFLIQSRVFLAGKPAKKMGAQGMKQLTKKEKNAASYLPYRNYKLLTTQEKSILLNQQTIIKFNTKSSVTITPQRSKSGRLKIKLLWKLSGEKAWKKTLFFKKNSKTLIGGPKNYLLSLEIK